MSDISNITNCTCRWLIFKGGREHGPPTGGVGLLTGSAERIGHTGLNSSSGGPFQCPGRFRYHFSPVSRHGVPCSSAGTSSARSFGAEVFGGSGMVNPVPPGIPRRIRGVRSHGGDEVSRVPGKQAVRKFRSRVPLEKGIEIRTSPGGCKAIIVKTANS